MIIVADANGTADGPAHVFLSRVNSEIPIVLVSRVQDFKFNEALLSLDKYILVDFVELGWQWNQQLGHIWGENTHKFPDVFPGDEWKRFDNFVAERPPLLIFQRELLRKDVVAGVLPIEYPNWQPSHDAQTKEQFNERRIELFHFWGFSHVCRKIFQGNAILHAVREDIEIIDNVFYYQNFLQENHRRYWATIHIPHFARMPINQILEINGNAKLSLSLPGAGVKCFRSTGESPVNSLMCIPFDELAWSYPWEHGVNCIRFELNNAVVEIEHALRRDDLYELYLSGVANAENYRVENYIRNYIEKQINEL